MAKKGCKCPPEGAPSWMLTYGDMMTLLLCFFVLIVSFSEIKKEDEFLAVVQEIQKAFGMKGGGGKMPTDEDPTMSLIERLEALRLRHEIRPNHANTEEPGMEGRETTVTKVREGLLFAVGGRITFEPGSADLSNDARLQLRKVADLIRGYNNLIEVRGHAATLELKGFDSPYADLWELSSERAKIVMEYLIGEEAGLRRERFRLIANADREPLVHRAYSVADQRPNRRVEVLVSEALVQEFKAPE